MLTFHAGDMLDLGVTVDSPVYHADGYEVSYDGRVSYNIIRSPTELFLEPDTDCVIRPRVVKDSGNRIEIIHDSTNFDNLEIKNVIPQSDLTGDYKGRYFLGVNPDAKTLEERIRARER